VGEDRATRRSRLDAARLYVVSDARRRQGGLEAFLGAILDAGVDVLQLREKDADAADLLRWGVTFADAARARGALFLVDDRPDVALALGADGVHVGQRDLPAASARQILGSEAIIGLSCHSAQDHAEASPEADYLTAGPVWSTPTKPGRRATGLDLVRSAAGGVHRPWFAIGGIGLDNVGKVVDAGASRIAVVRAVTEADDPAAAVRSLLAALPN
jgi:thiamine-phosphate pyrophosphorylase